jgi:hypothetical protein
VVIPGGTEHEAWFREDTEVIDGMKASPLATFAGPRSERQHAPHGEYKRPRRAPNEIVLLFDRSRSRCSVTAAFRLSL